MKIKKIEALEILDSRGNPTVQAFVTLNSAERGVASVPSGASTGSHEAYVLFDNDKNRYSGKGNLKAVRNIEQQIAPLLKGKKVDNLLQIDAEMIDLDGTPDKSRIGSNAMLAVSLACADAYAKYKAKPLWSALNKYFFSSTKPSLPKLMANIVNGGKHAGWTFPIQEFMVVPRTRSVARSVRCVSEIFHSLKALLQKRGHTTLVGDEGGFSPSLKSNREALEVILEAGRRAGYTVRSEYALAIDSASNEFYKDGLYRFENVDKAFTPHEISRYYCDLIDHYPLLSIEDPFMEDAWEDFATLTKQVHKTCQIVGDDLYTTDPTRIEKGVLEKATNAVLIKPNQIGTLSQTVEAIQIAQEAGMSIVVSHRSGETSDTFIADLAVACGAEYIKTGSVSRSERLAKYNRLLEIEKFEL